MKQHLILGTLSTLAPGVSRVVQEKGYVIFKHRPDKMFSKHAWKMTIVIKDLEKQDLDWELGNQGSSTGCAADYL